jgi:hypothetical protein
MLRDTPQDKEIEQGVDYVLRIQPALNPHRQALSRKLIQNIQDTKLSAVGGPFLHEIVAPHVIFMFGT